MMSNQSFVKTAFSDVLSSLRLTFNIHETEPAKRFWTFQITCAIMSSLLILVELAHVAVTLFSFLLDPANATPDASWHDGFDTEFMVITTAILCIHTILFVPVFTSCVRRLKTCGRDWWIALLHFTVVLGPVVYMFCISEGESKPRGM